MNTDDYLNGFERSIVEGGYAALDDYSLRGAELTAPEWTERFDTICRLVPIDGAMEWAAGNPRETVSDFAIRRLADAVVREARQRYRHRQPAARIVERRLKPILGAVAARERSRVGAVGLFGHELGLIKYYPRHQRYVLDWLASLRNEGFAEAGILTAEIVARAWGDTWNDASPQLIRLLDHPDDTVRADGANALGELCNPYPPESAPIEQTFNLISEKEISRPGVAAAFWWGADEHIAMLEIDGKPVPVEPKRWMMNMLLHRQGSEPEIPHFNSLESVAASAFEGDIDFIRESLAAGLHAVALWAAVETESPLPGLSEILDQLSDTTDRFHLWAVSLALARVYGRSCKRGEESGLVTHFIDQHAGVDILMLTDEDEPPGYPRCAVLRPLGPGETWDDSAAWGWADLLVPPQVRGELLPHRDGFESQDAAPKYRFASDVFVDFYGDIGARAWHRVEVVANGVHEAWNMESQLPARGPGVTWSPTRP